jgi:alpha-glucosidase
MKMLLLMSLRGNAILFNGEELGLTQVDVPFHHLQDPEAIANWPLTLSRDGVRTPIPWKRDAANAGFTTGTPWLPIGEDHPESAVDVQDGDPASLLNLTRQLIALRKANPALATGSMTVGRATDTLLIFERAADGQKLCCAFNLGADPVRWQPDGAHIDGVLTRVNDATPQLLPPRSGLIIDLGA